MWAKVSYPELVNKYDYYTWDASIGSFGGFSYKKDNKIIDNKPITLENIDTIKICKDIPYTLKNNILGLSKTSVELPYVPLNTEYGWDDKNNCWTYFTEASSDAPQYYSSYLIT